MICDLGDYDIGFIGEYNPDDGYDCPFCPVCEEVDCICEEIEEREHKEQVPQ